jgi:predicted glycogen debranching enzyme
VTDGDAMVPVLGPADVTGLDSGTAREWLLTDGLGGYATGTAADLRTRRYHGLLVVTSESGRPSSAGAPVAQRHLALASLDASLVVGQTRHRLATHAWADGAVDPAGHRLLATVEVRAGTVASRWQVGDVVVEREVAMAPGRPAVAAVFRLVRAPGPVRLDVAAVGTWRDAHGLRAGGADVTVTAAQDGVVVDGAWRVRGPGYTPGTGRWRGVHYREEVARGQDATEDVWHVAGFGVELEPGSSTGIVAWAGDAAALAEPPPPAQALVSDAHRHARTVLARVGATPRDGAMAALLLAADQFVVAGPGVVAGYPWFGEWSRDTFTSYEGLFLATGRADLGREVLLRAAGRVSEGMLANTADGGRPEFNTLDAAPWFLHAVRRHVEVSGDTDLAAEVAPTLTSVVEAHLAGTRYGIRVDDDGLLTGGGPDTPGTALTWMDARVAGVPVTPRHGKPVEVNALWVSGLAGVASLLAGARRPASDVDRVRRLLDAAWASFLRRFVDVDGRRTGAAGSLLDVVDGPDGDDATTRPNQLLAVSLPDGPLRAGTHGARDVVRAVRHLVTPLGLRTLSPGHPAYRGRHRGTPAERDTAYHQGTVWPWLVGPYVDAVRHAGDGVDGLLDGLLAHVGEAGLGSVSETADGDAPHAVSGAPFQAWSVAELLRVLRLPSADH